MIVHPSDKVLEFAAKVADKKKKLRASRFTWNAGDTVEIK